MKLTSQISLPLRILFLAVMASFAAHSNANPLGNLTGGRVGLPDRQPLEQRLDSRSSLTASEAINIAEQRYGGRAVGAKKISSGNGTAYSVRILQDNGKIRNVIIND